MLAVLAGTGGCTSRPGQAATGEGELELSDDGSELPFPAGFVEPADGSVVKIGRFEATLRATP